MSYGVQKVFSDAHMHGHTHTQRMASITRSLPVYAGDNNRRGLATKPYIITRLTNIICLEDTLFNTHVFSQIWNSNATDVWQLDMESKLTGVLQADLSNIF